MNKQYDNEKLLPMDIKYPNIAVDENKMAFRDGSKETYVVFCIGRKTGFDCQEQIAIISTDNWHLARCDMK